MNGWQKEATIIIVNVFWIAKPVKDQSTFGTLNQTSTPTHNVHDADGTNGVHTLWAWYS